MGDLDFFQQRVELHRLQAVVVGAVLHTLQTGLPTGWSVVVLDLKMPGLDGLDALSLFKKFDPAMEVIIVSGHGSTAEGIEGMRRGLFDYLMKPVEIDDLVARIKDAADKRREALS